MAVSERKSGQTFYIGKGHGKRAWSKKGRNVFWKRTVEKYGIEVVILAAGLSEIAALSLECAFILTCGRDSLCNMTDGGEGSSGYVPTDDARRKISEGNKGRSPTIAHREKIRVSKMGHFVSAETRKKIGEASIGRKKSKAALVKLSKPVICSNGSRFDSISDAARWLKANGFPKASKGNLAQACAGGRYKTVCGFGWAYAPD